MIESGLASSRDHHRGLQPGELCLGPAPANEPDAGNQ